VKLVFSASPQKLCLREKAEKQLLERSYFIRTYLVEEAEKQLCKVEVKALPNRRLI
jgi:hypothetical protein